MPSKPVAAGVCRSRLQDNIDPSYPLTFDNVATNSPSIAHPSGITLACSVRMGTTDQAELTGVTKRERTPGVFIVMLTVDEGKGDGALRELAETVAALFRNQKVSGVVFRTPYEVHVGLSSGKWQLNLNCPFYFDEVPS